MNSERILYPSKVASDNDNHFDKKLASIEPCLARGHLKSEACVGWGIPRVFEPGIIAWIAAV